MMAKDSSMWKRTARFAIGDIVQHRHYPFRGVVFGIDPTFSNTEEWWQAIPAEARPVKDQPYYHLLAENDRTTYVAYVSEQNLLPDRSGHPCRHPEISEHFSCFENGRYLPRPKLSN
jgi:heat shock protein HspQ